MVCKPMFVDVVRDRGETVGVAEFETREEMERVIRKLDDTGAIRHLPPSFPSWFPCPASEGGPRPPGARPNRPNRRLPSHPYPYPHPPEFKNPFEQCFVRITEDRSGG